MMEIETVLVENKTIIYPSNKVEEVMIKGYFRHYNIQKISSGTNNSIIVNGIDYVESLRDFLTAPVDKK